MLILIGSFAYICVGYGGFVPRTHELFGKDYEHATHDALNLITDERKKQEMVLTTPVSTAKTQIYVCVVGSQGFGVTLYLEAQGRCSHLQSRHTLF